MARPWVHFGLDPVECGAYTLGMRNHIVSSNMDPYSSDAPAEAKRLRARATRASRWFAGYLALVGAASAACLVLIETVFADGFARAVATAAWAVAITLAGWWAEGHDVHPRGATRYQVGAFATWFGMYLLLIGPFVRGTYGQELLPWINASAVMSLPFFVAAGLVLVRR